MKTNLFLSCFAVILLFLAYTERHALPPPVNSDVEETKSAPLFSLAPEAVTKITIGNAQQCLVARKEADSGDFLREVSGVLLQGRVVRRFSPPVADLSAYGLAPAPWRIALAHGDETRQPVLLLGRLNPVGNAVYARWDDGEDVLLVGSYFLTAGDVVFERLRSFSLHAGIVTDASCEEEKTVTQ